MATRRSDLRAGRPAGLDALLAARDDRAERRGRLLAEVGMPVVTVTTVMPGPIKDCELSRVPFAAALDAVAVLAAGNGWVATIRHRAMPATGPEALVAVGADGPALKRALVGLEEAHPLGRLFDLDVAASDGHSIGRAELGLPARRCFVCGRPAKECGRSGAHALDELLTWMEDRIDAWLGTSA